MNITHLANQPLAVARVSGKLQLFAQFLISQLELLQAKLGLRDLIANLHIALKLQCNQNQ